jgi:hypothetical protein
MLRITAFEMSPNAGPRVSFAMASPVLFDNLPIAHVSSNFF